MKGEEVASELINVLSAKYGISSRFLLAVMRDRAAVNNAALATLSHVGRCRLLLAHHKSCG